MRSLTRSIGMALAGAILAAPVVNAQSGSTDVPRERLDAREWFRDAKFGLFIHWGVYSLLGAGEWVMNNRSIRVADYEYLASTFNPVKFNAAEWVAIAKNAGMRYITITARHHDGFSMFASKVSPYNIVEWTPFKRDPLRELAEECQRQGLKLFFYYSQLDWRAADYYPRGRTGLGTGRPDAGDWSKYIDFMDCQLEELLTNYGPLGGIWFDGMWDKPAADWRLAGTYDLIHRLQPAALIVPNHHLAPLPGEDAQTFEQDLPGSNSTGFNTTTISDLPMETSLTMNGSWGFSITDQNFKSTREIIHYLVRAAGFGANLLLNVGPRPDGTIQSEAVDRLHEVGRWTSVYGQSVYSTRRGPVPPRSWGATTQRGDTVFVHVLDWPDRTLSLPALGRRILSAAMLDGTETVPFSQNEQGVVLTLPARPAEQPDRVVILRMGPVPRQESR